MTDARSKAIGRAVVLAGWIALAPAVCSAQALRLYFVDVEGGQATLVVTPSGQSMLVDTGWPTDNLRDAERIAAAAKKAGVGTIDYLVITHYHADHVGGMAFCCATQTRQAPSGHSSRR